ncbi:hypothetical protein Dimus_023504 [Dionaea muscipula]
MDMGDPPAGRNLATSSVQRGRGVILKRRSRGGGRTRHCGFDEEEFDEPSQRQLYTIAGGNGGSGFGKEFGASAIGSDAVGNRQDPRD